MSIVVVTGLLIAADDQAVNHVGNPGFEVSWLAQADGVPGLHRGLPEPAHWWPRHAHQLGQALYEWDLSTAYSGGRSIRVKTRRQDPAVPLYEAWTSLVPAQGLAGSTITLRAMVKTEGLDDSASVEFRIHAFRNGITVGDPCGAAARMATDAQEWTEHAITFVVPGEADDLLIQLGIFGRGTAWFDEASLTIDTTAVPSQAVWSADLADPRLIFVADAPVLRQPATLAVEPLPKTAWNVLLYAAADFWSAFTPLESFAAKVYSNPQVNVLILEDYIGLDAAIWFVDRSGSSIQLTPMLELGEVGTDGPEALERFLRFAEDWFPAERTLLYFYGHGHAWWGSCNDQSNDSTANELSPIDWLTPAEMRTALEAVNGVDAVMFSAPCLMSSLEAAYELRNVTDLYVASEEVSGYTFWKEAVAPIAASLAADPDQDAFTLGQTTIDAIRKTVQAGLDSGDSRLPHQPTITATATAFLTDVAAAVDAFALALTDALPHHRAAIAAARDASTDFAYGELVDAYAFAQGCLGAPGLAEVAAGVAREIDRAVIAQVANIALDGEVHGLSLYFPVIESGMPESGLTLAFDDTGEIYRDYGLSFLADTQWLAFLEAFFAPQPGP